MNALRFAYWAIFFILKGDGEVVQLRKKIKSSTGPQRVTRPAKVPGLRKVRDDGGRSSILTPTFAHDMRKGNDG